MRILHVGRFGSHLADQMFSGVFGIPMGWPKNKENPGFLWLSQVRAFIVPFRLLMVTCRLDIPSCLQMFHSSLHSYSCCYVVLHCGGSVSLCLFVFIFVALFTLRSVVSLCCLLSWCDKNQIKSQNISNFDCHLLFRCLHPHTFTWPR